MKKKILVLLVCVVLLCMTAGCGESLTLDNGNSLVIIVGKHANANMYEKMPGIVDEMLESAVNYSEDASGYKAEIKVSIIICDGNPSQVSMSDIELEREAQDSEKIVERAEKSLDKIKDLVRDETLKADNEEVDLAAAINQAKLLLKANPGKENHILILDSGIPTSGLINFSNLDFCNGTTEEVVNRVDEGAHYDLSEIEVTFYGIGNVAGDQYNQYMEFFNDQNFQNRLTDFWTIYLSEKCKASEVDATYILKQGTEMVFSEDHPDSYPFVTVVDFVKTEDVDPAPAPTEHEDEEKPELPPLSAKFLGFKPGKAEFRNETDAINKLAKYAETMKAHLNENPDQVFYIVGSIAKTSADAFKEHSKVAAARAEKVKEILVDQYGLDAERLIVIDAGTKVFSWRNAEEFPEGCGPEGVAENLEANRVVAIIHESETKLVQELIDQNCIG